MKKIILFLVCISLFALSSCFLTPYFATHITDISEYNEIMKTCGYFNDRFPQTIPDNAEVVEFVYHYEESRCTEAYLELKFKTAEELLAFVDELKNNIGKDDVAVKQNHVVEHYTDVYKISSGSYSEQEGRFYYYRHTQTWLYAGYDVCSYSETDLTVIITVIYADIRSSRYTPRYFERFNIPMQYGTEYKVYLEQKE